MFNRLKMKFAAKRMQRQKDFSAEKNFIRENATLLGQIILWPFRMIGRVIRWTWDTICAICSWIWAVLCEINLVGLINLALLVAIIVLCSMLILDILNCRRKPVVVSGPAQNVPVEYTKTKKTIPVQSRPQRLSPQRYPRQDPPTLRPPRMPICCPNSPATPSVMPL